MSESEETKREEASQPAAKRPMEKRKRLGITLGCIAVVLVVAGAGFMVWHEQPSFCNAICHDPMDPYLPTFEATPGQPATDKWGNEVEDASACWPPCTTRWAKPAMDCHVPQLDEQMTEGAEWVTGNYDSPLGERTSTQLVRRAALRTPTSSA